MATLTVTSDMRIGAIGRTGTGKTYFMRHLLKPQPRVICVDSKQRVNWEGYQLTYDADAALIPDKVIYRHTEDLPPRRFWDNALDALHEKGGGVIYIDELPVITSSNRAPEGLKRIFRLGREIGVGCWWAGQEATGVNNTMIRQSDIIALFLNHGASDRDKIIETCGDIGEVTAGLGFYEFVVFQSYGEAYDPQSIPIFKIEGE